jgi:AraC-like DNA-binding protein
MPPAKLGTASSTSLGASCPSDCVIGLTTVIRFDRWYQCLVHLFRCLAGDGDRSLPWLTALQDPRLARAIDKILDDPAADHTVSSLAETASMSRSTFAEHFAAAFERSPMSLVHYVRMQRATRLLREGTLTIDQVARRVGFSSRSHFSRAFKKHTGTSPITYRDSASAGERNLFAWDSGNQRKRRPKGQLSVAEP